MFNSEYYKAKKNNLSNAYIKKMENTLINLGNTINDYLDAKTNFQTEIQEINEIQKEAEAKNLNEEVSKKPEIKK